MLIKEGFLYIVQKSICEDIFLKHRFLGLSDYLFFFLRSESIEFSWSCSRSSEACMPLWNRYRGAGWRWNASRPATPAGVVFINVINLPQSEGSWWCTVVYSLDIRVILGGRLRVTQQLPGTFLMSLVYNGVHTTSKCASAYNATLFTRTAFSVCFQAEYFGQHPIEVTCVFLICRNPNCIQVFRPALRNLRWIRRAQIFDVRRAHGSELELNRNCQKIFSSSACRYFTGGRRYNELDGSDRSLRLSLVIN